MLAFKLGGLDALKSARTGHCRVDMSSIEEAKINGRTGFIKELNIATAVP